MKARVKFNVVGFLDRRSEDLHARYDSIEQRRFAQRLARNPKERDRQQRTYPLLPSAPTITSRQAD